MRGMMRLAIMGVPGAQGGAAALPTEITDDFSADSGAWLDGDLQPAAITVANGRGIWTPDLEDEALTNSDFEAGDPPTGWVGNNISRAEDPRTDSAGLYSLNILRATSNTSASQNRTLIAGGWYLFSGWRKNVDASDTNMVVRLAAVPFTAYFSRGYDTSTSWLYRYVTGRVAAAGCQVYLGVRSFVGDNKSGRFDDLSLKQISPASLYRLQRVYYPSSVEVDLYLSEHTQKGIVYYKDANNWIKLWFTRESSSVQSPAIKLLKRVAGVDSAELASVNTGYVAGGQLRLVPNAAFTAFSALYEATEVFADVALNDFAADVSDGVFTTPWYVGLFSTYDAGDVDADSFDNLSVAALF